MCRVQRRDATGPATMSNGFFWLWLVTALVLAGAGVFIWKMDRLIRQIFAGWASANQRIALGETILNDALEALSHHDPAKTADLARQFMSMASLTDISYAQMVEAHKLRKEYGETDDDSG